MFDPSLTEVRRTGRLVPDTGWASEPESTRSSTPRKGSPPVTTAPAKKVELPARLPNPITTPELRGLAGNTSYKAEIRLGFVIISMWLSRQPSTTIGTSRRVASNMGTDLYQGKMSLAQVVETVFPNEPLELLVRKAKAMVTVLEGHKKLDENVIDLAVSHISSKCTCTEKSVAMAEDYAAQLRAVKPSFLTFNGDADMWWPDFTTE